MRYKIKIYQYGCLMDEYETDTIEDVVKWFTSKWLWVEDNGDCCSFVYEDGRELDYDELFLAGFYGNDL